MLKPITTTIAAVTVYTDRALIKRQGTLTGEETYLTLANLPTTLDPDSVRVSGRGQTAVQLQGVTIDRQFTTEPNPRIKPLDFADSFYDTDVLSAAGNGAIVSLAHRKN
jgi:N-terminal domain of unknown function (DUF4140)